MHTQTHGYIQTTTSTDNKKCLKLVQHASIL